MVILASASSNQTEPRADSGQLHFLVERRQRPKAILSSRPTGRTRFEGYKARSQRRPVRARARAKRRRAISEGALPAARVIGSAGQPWRAREYSMQTSAVGRVSPGGLVAVVHFPSSSSLAPTNGRGATLLAQLANHLKATRADSSAFLVRRPFGLRAD